MLQRIPVLPAPSGGGAQHHTASVCFELLDQFFAGLKTGTPFDLIVEADPPDGHQRLALVMLIGGVFRDVHSLSQHTPVIEHRHESFIRHSRDVIHDSIGPPVAVGPFTRTG